MIFNKAIDFSVFTQMWAVDFDWGMQRLLQYHTDMAIAEVHGLASLNYNELKSQNAPSIFTDGGFATGDLTQFKGKGGIAILNLEGVMRIEDGLCSYGIDTLVRDLYNAYANPGIIGVVLKINSGGGSVIAGELLKSALTDAPKPVVGLAYLMASGALYGTLPIKNILATGEMAIIGSIGVVYSMNKKLAAWYKDNMDDIYASKSTEKNVEWNAYLNGDRTLYERSADGFAEIFGNAVMQFRMLSPEQAAISNKGKTFNGKEALNLNLITGYGNLNDAINLVLDMAANQQDNMALQASFISHLNRLFPALGFNEKTTDVEAAEKLAAINTVSPAEMTSQIETLEQSLNSTTNLVGDLQSSISTMQSEIKDLTATNKSLTDSLSAFSKNEDLTALTERIATVESNMINHVDKNTKPEKPKSNTIPTQSLETFQKKVADIEIVGEAKY